MISPKLEIIVPLRLRGITGDVHEVDAVVDTGFTASLTLSEEVIHRLGLTRTTTVQARLADNIDRDYFVYDLELEWAGVWTTVSAWSVPHQPLIGLKLLANHRLFAEFRENGFVEIQHLADTFVPP